MGLDDIQLTSQLCANIYSNGLVIDNMKTSVPENKIAFKGKNLKSVLVLTDVPGQLKTEDVHLLENLLKACQLTEEDIALINLPDQPITVSEIFNQLKIKKALLFGIPTLSVDLDIPDMEDMVLNSGNCKVLKTLPLYALQKNTQRKKTLWLALKSLFGV